MIPFQRPEPVEDDAVREQIARNGDLLTKARAAGDRAACLRLLGQIGSDWRALGDLTQAELFLSEGVMPARTLGDMQRLAVNMIRLATARQYLGRHVEDEALLREALALTETRAASDYEDFALQHLGRCLVEMDRVDEAIECLDCALVLRWMRADPDLIASTEQALNAAHILRQPH